MDRIRNEGVRGRAGIERGLPSRADQRVLRWFGYVERMDEYRMARRVLMAEVSGGRVRGRPRLDWMDGVKVALGYLAIFLQLFFLGLFGHFCLALCFFGLPSPALLIITRIGLG